MASALGRAVSSPPVVTSAPAGLAAGDEPALILRVQRGDAAARDELVRRYLRRAYAAAYRVLGHREDAEDLVQDAFLAVFEHIGDFDPTRPFGPWFFRIIANRALNARKRRWVRRAEPLAESVGDRAPSPDSEVVRREIGDRFREAVAELPERQRTIVQLIDVDGLERGEVAELLGIAAGTVRWHLHEAHAALRRALAPVHGEER